MKKTKEQLHEEYGFKNPEFQKDGINPTYKKWVRVADEIDRVYELACAAEISLGKAKELTTAIIEKNFILSKPALDESLPLEKLYQLLFEVDQLIGGWNATEIEWSEWDKKVHKKVIDTMILIAAAQGSKLP